MPLTAGTRLGPYEIVAPVGAGGMGEVYRAADTRLNRSVAVKILPAAFAEDPDRLRRFEQEAQAAGGLNHPNIIAVHDFGRQGGYVYVVTELLEGETLRERMGAPVPVRKAVEYAIQAARGLSAAHAKGITHRDIKPENLFLTNGGFLKILDFGLAKVAVAKPAEKTSAPTTPFETGAGVVMGTAGYMSPEQVRGAAIDSRSDIFSLGVLLYEMVAGKRAFGGNSSIETMSAILKEEPEELPESVPPALARIVRRCLEKKPEERFESARDLAFALETISSGSGGETPLAAGGSRRRVVFWAAAAAILVTVAATSYIAGRRNVPASALRYHRVTFRRGMLGRAVFANDGKTIIYSAAWDGKPFEMFSAQETSPESRALGTNNGHPVSISKNGEMLIIRSNNQMGWGGTSGTLSRMAVSGGAPRDIADGVYQADWSPDGNQFAVVRGAASGQVVEYPIGRKIYETQGYISALHISPRGDWIALADAPLSGDAAAYLVVINTRGLKKASSQRWNTLDGLGWSPDGSEVWFAGGETGDHGSLFAMDLTGRQRLIGDMPPRFFVSDISPDGRVLLLGWSTSGRMMFHPAGTASETDLYWHDWSGARDISRDRSQILFSEGGDASSDDFVTYVRGVDGSAAVELGKGLAMAFSPDGQWAMANPSAQPSQLIAYPVHAGQPRPLTSDAIRHVAGRWLPDGKRIVFVGSEQGRPLRYYVQDSPESKPRAISGEGVPFDRVSNDVIISPDAESVVAVSAKGLEILPVKGGKSRAVPGVAPGASPLAWGPDESLLVYRSGEIPARIMRVSLKSGEQRLWRELVSAERTGLRYLTPIRIAPDCESYAYSPTFATDTLLVMRGVR